MIKSLKPFIFITALVLLGAGCAESGQVAIPAQQGNAESALSFNANGFRGPSQAPQPVDVPAPASEADSSTPSPTKNMYERPTQFPGVLPEDERLGKTATIETAKGAITFEIFGDEAPKAASNFIALARSGYYDSLTFHRVEPGFVIQGGDPSGNGTGGPGYKFEDEPVKRDYDAGIVAMANAGPNTNGSQFFIMLEDNGSLPKNYTIFGKVTAGLDVVRAIRVGDIMSKVVIK